MELREFGPDDAAAKASYVDVDRAVDAVDSPWRHPLTPYRLEMEMRHGWDGEVSRYFLAEDDGVVVGTLEVSTSDYDNLDVAWLGLHVHPDHRRRGHGTAMLDLAEQICRESGRPLLGIDGWESEASAAWAARVGFAPKSRAINRRQHLDEVEDGLFERVHDEARRAAADYELLTFDGRSPDELVEAISVMSASINDAPLDDLELEDEAYPPERIRAYEEAQLASGRRFHRLVARHVATGELAGHTVVVVDVDRPAIGEQHDTTVVKAHRGHRLGALLKSAMCLHLRDVEPALRTVDTWNAESNDHMIAVNELLGYRVMGREINYQKRI